MQGSTTTLRQLLDQRAREGRRVGLDDAIAIIVPLCVDAKARHDRGESLLVHPSCIVIGQPGIARIEPSLATAPTHPHDRATIAPELQRSMQPGNARATVFSVGAILYEMVTGTHIGPGMRRPQDVDPSLPDALEVLLAKALVGDPPHRPDDLGALAQAMHHIAPMKSIPPPDADVSRLDRGTDFELDVKFSMLPPHEAQARDAAPPSVPRGPAVPVIDRTPPRPLDATAQLAQLKQRLEADPRPRYVVNKDKMDHGPFTAVELLQQIASHQFVSTDGLRDELSGQSNTIGEWEEFAPFAESAKLTREIAVEKKEVQKAEKAELRGGIVKWVVGAAVFLALLSGLLLWVLTRKGSRGEGATIIDDPNAIDLNTDGGIAAKKKAGGGGGGGGGGGKGGGAFSYGMSYEAALGANNQEISMGGPQGGPDLSNAQLSAPMRNATFISGCGAPDDMKVTVRVAVKMGRAVGVTVITNPPNPGVAACIDRHVRGLGWPAHPKMDFITTSY